MGFAFDFTEPDLPDNLQYLVPNSYAQRPSMFLYDRDILMMSIVFVALEAIEDQELLLNYRLNPNLKLPDWYQPVDIDEDTRRWSSD